MLLLGSVCLFHNANHFLSNHTGRVCRPVRRFAALRFSEYRELYHKNQDTVLHFMTFFVFLRNDFPQARENLL